MKSKFLPSIPVLLIAITMSLTTTLLPSTSFAETNPACDQLNQKLQTLSSTAIQQLNLVADYFQKSSTLLNQWYGEMSPAEGRNTYVPAGQFANIRAQANDFGGSATDLKAFNDQLSAQLAHLQKLSAECAKPKAQ